MHVFQVDNCRTLSVSPKPTYVQTKGRDAMLGCSAGEGLGLDNFAVDLAWQEEQRVSVPPLICQTITVMRFTNLLIEFC